MGKIFWVFFRFAFRMKLELFVPDDIRQLFPSEFELTEELGWVPMGWEIKPLDKIAHYQNGLAMQKFRPDNESQFLPVLKIAQLKKGATDGKEKLHKFKRDEILRKTYSGINSSCPRSS